MELYFRDKLYITEELNDPKENIKSFIEKHIDQINSAEQNGNDITLLSLVQNNGTTDSSTENTNEEQPQQTQQASNNTEIDNIAKNVENNIKLVNGLLPRDNENNYNNSDSLNYNKIYRNKKLI